MLQATTAKLRLGPNKPARFNTSAPSTAWFDRLLRTQCAIYRCLSR